MKQKKDSEIIIFETDLNQALNQWIKINKNMNQKKTVKSAAEAAKQNEAQETAKKMQDNMIKCM